jgi:hypothetical protein
MPHVRKPSLTMTVESLRHKCAAGHSCRLCTEGIDHASDSLAVIDLRYEIEITLRWSDPEGPPLGRSPALLDDKRRRFDTVDRGRCRDRLKGDLFGIGDEIAKLVSSF